MRCICPLLLFFAIVFSASAPLAAEPALSAGEEGFFLNFFDEITLENGLVLDRESNRKIVSSAATGFIAYSKAIAAQKGQLKKDETLKRIRKGFRNTLKATPAKTRGWLYHFTDPLGVPLPGSEVSTIDSALFYLGHLRAAETLESKEFIDEVNQAISDIDLKWMMVNGLISHGRQNKTLELIPYQWDEYSEGVLLYRLFELEFTPAVTAHDLPLFVYYYPLCFYDDEAWKTELKSAVAYQFDTHGISGITATDGPLGYQAGDPSVVSPLALWAASRIVPAASESLATLEFPRTTLSYSLVSDWIASDRIAIDYGSTYIMLHRY